MNIQLVEETIEKLDSVVSSRIILDSEKDFMEVHIVSNGIRPAKQMVRDIQSVLIATYNIQIDHKKISIAEIQDENVEKIKCRLELVSISYDSNGQKISVKVCLGNCGDIFESSLVGINTNSNLDRMLVNATLRSVENAYGYEDTFMLEDIKTVDISTDKAVVVIVSCIKNNNVKKLCGASLVKLDHKEAVVKATLDAINRYTLE